MRRFCAKCAWVFLCVDASYEPLSLSGLHSVFFLEMVFRKGDVFVPMMNEPLGCQLVNFTSIVGEYNDNPPLLAMDFHWMMKGGVFIDF